MKGNIAERDRYNQLLERLRIVEEEINSFDHKREYEPARNLEREREQIRKELEQFSEAVRKENGKSLN